MTAPAMKLMNCTRCDDVVKLVEYPRQCECGACRGRTTEDGANVEVTGSPRVLCISWEAYDGAQEGEARAFTVLPKAQYRAKGGL